MSTREELLARQAEREAKHQEWLEALEVEALTLKEKYIEAGKKPGVDFAVVSSLIGNFVVRNPDAIVAKRFLAAKDPNIEEVMHFVAPSTLFPDSTVARPLLQEHGGVAWKLAEALLKLYSAEANVTAGK